MRFWDASAIVPLLVIDHARPANRIKFGRDTAMLMLHPSAFIELQETAHLVCYFVSSLPASILHVGSWPTATIRDNATLRSLLGRNGH